jgi:Mrp family chromosome partitioning ATPase
VQAKTILIIDKDIITRKFLMQTLAKRGHHVLQAELAKEGLVFAWRDKPDIIVVDPLFSDISSELFIQKIRQDGRTASTPVIALSANLSEEFGKACITQGYTKYYPKVGDAIPKFVAVLEGLGHTSALPAPEKPKDGKVIVFLSGKGGTGVSSIAANIATTLKGLNKTANIALVDMVLPLGSLAPLLGYEESINISTLAEIPSEELTAEFMKATLPYISNWKISLMAGSPNPEAANLLQSKKLPRFINILSEEFDYILVDLGRSLSRINLSIIQEAHLTCMIVGMDIDEKKIYPVINRSVGLDGLTKAETEAKLGTEIKMTIPYMGWNFTVANNHSEAIVRKHPNDTGSMMIISLAKAIVETIQKPED